MIIIENKFKYLPDMTKDTVFVVQTNELWLVYKCAVDIKATDLYTSQSAETANVIIKISDSLKPLNAYDKVSDRNPTPDDYGNGLPGCLWYNYLDDNLFRLMNYRINDKAVWLDLSTDKIVCSSTVAVFDLFADNSSKFLYDFNDNINDTGGLYNLKSQYPPEYVIGLAKDAVKLSNENYLYSDISFDTPEGSVSLWTKPTVNGYRDECIFHLSKDGYNTMSIWVSKLRKKFFFTINNVSFYTDYEFSEKWYNIILTSSGDFYINSEKIDIDTDGVTADLTTVNLPMLIGADRDSKYSINNFYNGVIDECRFFTKIVNQDEVDLLYKELEYAI